MDFFDIWSPIFVYHEQCDERYISNEVYISTELSALPRKILVENKDEYAVGGVGNKSIREKQKT